MNCDCVDNLRLNDTCIELCQLMSIVYELTMRNRYGNAASIAQWLVRRPSDPAVIGSSHGWGGHICACHIEV